MPLLMHSLPDRLQHIGQPFFCGPCMKSTNGLLNPLVSVQKEIVKLRFP